MTLFYFKKTQTVKQLKKKSWQQRQIDMQL